MISIVLPTFNEVDNISIIITKLEEILRREDLAGEVIVVDDDSPDGTAEAAMGTAVELPVRVCVRKGDRGLSKSVIKGLDLSQNEICVVMDSDLSHPVDSIPDMVGPIIDGECDMCVGSRYIKGGGWLNKNTLRGMISRFAGFLARGVTTLTDPTSGFMALRKEILDDVNIDPLGWKIVLEIAVKARPGIKEIPILFSERNAGKSKLGVRAQFDYLHHLWKLYWFRYCERQVPQNKR